MRYLSTGIVILSILISLSPYLLNGSVFIGDSWVHISYARRILSTGRYWLGEYNVQWPMVNLLIAYISLLTGLKLVAASQYIPILAGLSIIPLYIVFKGFGLSSIEAYVSSLTYIFFPLYPIIILTSVVMKETSAIYLFSLLILYIIIISRDSRVSSKLIMLLLSIGLVLSHHFAGLVMIYILVSVSALALYKYYLYPGRERPGNILSLLIIYLSIFLLWNIYTVYLIGSFFIKTLYELLYIVSFLTIMVYFVNRFKPHLTASILAIPMIYLGFRGLIHDLITEEPPLSYGELLSLTILSIIFIYGVYRLMNSGSYKAIYLGILYMFITFLIWSPYGEGFVTFTKASHYIPVVLPPAAAIFFRRFGRFRFIIISIFLIAIASTSIYSIYLALNGLSAYKYSEVIATGDLTKYIPSNYSISTDTRGGYLIKYYLNHQTSDIGSRGLNIIYRVNEDEGVLLGYEWTKLEYFISRDEIIDGERLYDANIVYLINIS